MARLGSEDEGKEWVRDEMMGNGVEERAKGKAAAFKRKEGKGGCWVVVVMREKKGKGGGVRGKEEWVMGLG